MIGFMTSRLGALVGGALVALIVFAVQEFRLSRVQSYLLACEQRQTEANNAILKAQEDGRREGRDAANKDGERLRQESAETQRQLKGALVQLADITKRLNAPKPPVTVSVDGPLPVVVTPPAAMSCALERGPLDELTAFLNRGRVP